MKPVAIVIPWFGAELTGGAEQQAFQIATRLAARGHNVEVLTTCNRSFHADWSVNHYPAGASHEDGLTLRRFPVDARDAHAFDQVNAKLLALDATVLRPGVSPLSADEAHTFIHENIKSGALLEHLRNERTSYHAFIFLPYMFAPAMLGLPLVANRAWLQPCLHDEAAAYLPETAELFRRARALLFNSEGELELALQLYGPSIHSRSAVVGEGIERAAYEPEQPARALPASVRDTRFVLYLGRRDRVKNVDLLTRAFAQFKAAQPESRLQLVLAGPGAESFNADGVHDLGLVADETKAALLAHARALAQPSRNESFSRALMEAWSAGRPVIAHRDCLATAIAVERAAGGWLAANEAEWMELFARIEAASDEELATLGARGRVYAAEQADWDKTIARYEMLLGLTVQPNVQAHVKHAPEPRAIHQLLPDIVFGDAISNQARAIREHLRSFGYESEIFVKRREARLATEAQLFDETQPAPTDGLLYHHSIGSELTAFASAHAGPKCLVYHNVTPAEFYAPYRPGFAWMLETGRAHLPKLACHFPVSVGDSAFNAAELAACGFREPGVLPIIVDPDKWNIAPDAELMARLQDGRTNILFVGRAAPNKRQDRLVEMFAHYRAHDPHARLIIAGEGRAFDPYFNHVRATIKRLGLEAHVEVTGLIEDARLLAYYRTAHLYWSASEHEGFGAPLVEAMWFDVPVLALNITAVPETLATAGMLFAPDEELSSVAARAYQLTHEKDARRAVIAAQRARRLDFTSAAVQPILARLVERLTKVVALEPVA
ncbi:MAG: group 1 glycosyl transferase [Acidobacteria bacterium]|nr:MAG: group 1 glycosyl transferase [Acidobacteriota bacterium]